MRLSCDLYYVLYVTVEINIDINEHHVRFAIDVGFVSSVVLYVGYEAVHIASDPVRARSCCSCMWRNSLWSVYGSRRVRAANNVMCLRDQSTYGLCQTESL